jgi:hypothetical protein
MTLVNRFDPANYPDSEPTEVFVGERWAWTRSDITAAYPTASYTLSYRMCLQDASHRDIDITATKSDSKHVVEVGQSTTDGYDDGLYWWQAIVTRDSDSEEVVVGQGYIEIKADLDGHTGDTRTQAYKILSAIRATILGTASNEQSSYSIAGRSLSRRSIDELLQLEKEFARRWDKEKEAIDRAAGRAKSNRVLLRMGA